MTKTINQTVVKFEDEKLARYLAELMGTSVEGLTEELLATVEAIDLPFFAVLEQTRPRKSVLQPNDLYNRHNEEDQITSLKGLETCVNLKRINLIDHQITDLSPLQDLEKLELVILGKNNIESLEPLAGKTSIRILVVGENNLKDISAVTSLTGLEGLYVQSNPLTHDSLLFVNQLPKLNEFSFWGTKESYLKEKEDFRPDIKLLV